MKNQTSCSKNRVFLYQTHSSESTIKSVPSDIISILNHPDFKEQFSASGFEFTLEFIQTRHLQLLSRSHIPKEVFQYKARVLCNSPHRSRPLAQEQWLNLRDDKLAFNQRVKDVIVRNNILEVMKAALIAKDANINLDDNMLLHWAVSQKVYEERSVDQEYAIIRFLMDWYSTDVTKPSAENNESALDCSRKSKNPELIKILEEAKQPDCAKTTGSTKVGLPQKYAGLVDYFVEKTRELLKQGQIVSTNTFIVNTANSTLVNICYASSDDADLDETEDAIRQIAETENADFVFTVMEAWGLSEEKNADCDRICEEYGSIAESPYAIDACCFILETYEGLWVAQANIKPKGHSKKKRTIRDVEFTYADSAEGRFTNFLPKMDSIASSANSQ